MALFLTSFFYYVFSDWHRTSPIFRMSLITIAFVIVIGAYYLIVYFYKKHLFLPEWLFVVISLFYGLAIMLNGMAYNLHAPEYLFYILWLVPVMFLAIATQYLPVTLIAYVLAHAVLITSDIFSSGTANVYFIHLLIIFLNAIVFALVWRREGRVLKYVSFLVFWGAFLSLALSYDLPLAWLNQVVFGVLLVVAFFVFLKRTHEVMLLVITSAAAIIYVFGKLMRWVWENYGEFAFFIVLGLAIVIMLASSVLVALMRRGRVHEMSVRVISVAATVLATVLATSAIAGLFFIFFPESSESVLFFFALLILLPFGLFSPLPAQIRYTLVGTGYLLAVGMSQMETTYQILLLFLLALGFFIVKMQGMKFILILLAHSVLVMMLADLLSYETMLYVMMLVSVATYLLLRPVALLRYLNFSLAFVYLFLTTYIYGSAEVMNWIVHIVLFGAATLGIFIFHKEDLRGEERISYVVWFVFIISKYMEYGWEMIHFSIIAFIVAVIFLFVTYRFDKRLSVEEKEDAPYRVPLPWAISMIFGIMLLIVAYQWVTSELSLQDGHLVKIEVVDSWGYDGSTYYLDYEIEHLDDFKIEDEYGDLIDVALHEVDGVYEYAGNYRVAGGDWSEGEKPGDSQVIVTGRVGGSYSVNYGFEKHFDKSGTSDLSPEFAYVRVSSDGDGVLEKVE